MMWLPATLLFLVGITPALGQLTGSVGPTTASSAKRNTICNVLSYGGTVGSSVCIPFGVCQSACADFCGLGYRPGDPVRVHQLRAEEQGQHAVCARGQL